MENFAGMQDKLGFNCQLPCTYKINGCLESGADLGGRWTPPPPSGIRPPADPKGPPFVLFWDIHIWWWTLKIV